MHLHQVKQSSRPSVHDENVYVPSLQAFECLQGYLQKLLNISLQVVSIYSGLLFANMYAEGYQSIYRVRKRDNARQSSTQPGHCEQQGLQITVLMYTQASV